MIAHIGVSIYEVGGWLNCLMQGASSKIIRFMDVTLPFGGPKDKWTTAVSGDMETSSSGLRVTTSGNNKE